MDSRQSFPQFMTRHEKKKHKRSLRNNGGLQWLVKVYGEDSSIFLVSYSPIVGARLRY
jgi:hypothetical protein